MPFLSTSSSRSSTVRWFTCRRVKALASSANGSAGRAADDDDDDDDAAAAEAEAEAAFSFRAGNGTRIWARVRLSTHDSDGTSTLIRDPE